MPSTWERANCYGYALSLDICIAPGSSNEGESSIDWSDSGTDITGSHCKELIEACKHDGLAEADNESQFQIAVFINVYSTGLDYHFYRNDGGSWSHKLGNTGDVVTNLASPVEANKALVGLKDSNGHLIIKQGFCGYMYQKMKKSAEDFGL